MLINQTEIPNIDRTSDRTSDERLLDSIPDNIKSLVIAIGKNEMSVKEMMTTLELKHRPNFMAQLLSPAINMELVRMKYPDSPRHSKQRYLLTVRGLILIDNLDAQ